MKKYIIVLLHLAYWMMYLLMIAILFTALNHVRVDINQIVFYPGGVAAIIPGLIGFYTFYGLLFEKYLAKKKILSFILIAALLIAIAPIITEIIIYSVFPRRLDRSYNTILFAGIGLSFIALVNGIFGIVMKGFIAWYRDIQLKLELTKRNYEMELDLIKAQIHPHFLFNTINNIDTLIKKDPNTASEYLTKLSDIMRFMLYESKTDKISLAKEIAYIDKYVELQRIRTANDNFVKYETLGNIDSITIEPMLFIPFVENAFKHSENKKVHEAIKIFIKANNDKLYFECVNAYDGDQDAFKQGGLGNELIKRRLGLLYPNKHIFEVTNTGGYYKVKLEVDLSGYK